MKLPFFKNRPNPEKREYLFALEIGHETVKSAIWSVVNNKTQVLAIGTPISWDENRPEQLISAGDKTLSYATSHFDETGKTQPQKLVLGLPSDWVIDDKIIPEKLIFLKDLTQKLSLSAVGFVVTPHALIRHLQHVEGVPPTAILVSFGQRFIEVTPVHLGKITASHLVSRSASIPGDIIEGLSRFGKIDMLPSRILIYDSSTDLEAVRQELLSFPWQAPQTKLSFLHFPKIEVLPPDFSIKAISLAGGSEVAKSIGLIPPQAEKISESSSNPTSEVTPEDLGFYPDIDISASSPVSSPKEAVLPPKPKFIPKFTLPHLRLPHIRFPHFSVLPLVLVLFILILFGLGFAYWNLPKATITLLVSPKTIQQQLTVFTDSSVKNIDQPNRILPAKMLEVVVNGELAKNSSGSKLVGDKATGEVTIINGTPSPHDFPAKTQISVANNLKFTLDSSVTVASASGTADPSSYQPGKTNVKVTAVDIGSDSNLSAGSQFKIGSFSALDFIARNESAFTGGSSRQVSAVSKDDLSDLRSQLTDKLKNQAKEKLSQDQLSIGENLIESSFQYLNQNEKFDHQENDVADQVKLEITLKTTALAYSESQLNELVIAEISSQIPDGYELNGQPQKEIIMGTAKDKKIPLLIEITASLQPKINTQDIAKSITGVSPLQAKNILSSLPNITEVTISFSPKLPGVLLSLPHQTKNIKVLLQSN